MTKAVDVSIVKQDFESYSSLKLLFKGVARQLPPQFVGDLRLLFPEDDNAAIVFDWVSSVMYCDEMLWSQESYPYFKDVAGTNGLFRVEGSSYLKRIELFLSEPHHHYIYFDREFNWHITARGIEMINGPWR
ncbi:MAG: hypothetical protein Q4G36_07765 [Paracoccus sp. (in: a-proteobacteria)]|nr:hypothetical protein [Paracoccus sp. (in: a-proteobacteria)]